MNQERAHDVSCGAALVVFESDANQQHDIRAPENRIDLCHDRFGQLLKMDASLSLVANSYSSTYYPGRYRHLISVFDIRRPFDGTKPQPPHHQTTFCSSGL